MILALQIIGGFVALLIGGELLVRGASAIAVRLGISPLVVGVVIVGFGTSAPELVTCVRAALAGSPGIAMGNIVGSNIANILLILGAAALMRPFITSRDAVIRDGSIVIITAIAFGAAAWTGLIERWMGAIFVVALVAYIIYTIRADRRKPSEIEDVPAADSTPLILSIVYLLAGLVLVLVGAEYLVKGAVAVATLYNVSEEIIGLTLVAVGTSLPELATSIMAAIRRHSEIALGNVLGSNVYNTIGIGGITALVSPIPVSNGMRTFDVPMMVLISIMLVVVVATGRRVTRWEGAALLALYVGFIGLQAQSA
ncbi:calcium/sodium antiporter [Acuticoccus sp. MNP-M23]|uniref:calcium/sodium antiporter n=1 Tax=Acuticoccus sp. MNP-M23 TaxID=3072793 RepID=UPI0028163AEC|nr:calcium/sodium antiporter [Acuticoccus sp. MNP-M23]WMS42887.1 calcium/sodium antiporter [Acuticoccus sp. MNP-M23]